MVSASIGDKVVAYSALHFLVTENKPATISRLKEDTLLKRLGIHIPNNMAIGCFLRQSHLFVKSGLSRSHSNPAGDTAAEYCLALRVYGDLLKHEDAITRCAGLPMELAERIHQYAGK